MPSFNMALPANSISDGKNSGIRCKVKKYSGVVYLKDYRSEAESKEKHGVSESDPMPELTITSPYVDSWVDSNTCTMGLGNPRVRRGYVVSASGSPGFESRPAPLPWFSPGKSRSRKVLEQIFPSAAAGDSSAAAGVSAHHQGWILYQYCRQKIRKINKKSAEKGTKKKKKALC